MRLLRIGEENRRKKKKPQQQNVMACPNVWAAVIRFGAEVLAS